MRREWMEPVIEVQEFVANEYVAACGDSGKVYNFECNAGQKGHYYNVYYYDGSGQKKYIAKKSSLEDLLWGSHAQFSNYHPCNATHKAESDSGFISGFIDDQSTSVDEATPVVIWTENGTNVHCTTKLDITTWQTAKS